MTVFSTVVPNSMTDFKSDSTTGKGSNKEKKKHSLRRLSSGKKD